MLDAPSTWAHHNQFTLFLLRFDHPCNIPAVLYLVGGLHPHPLLQVVGQSLLAADEDRRVWLHFCPNPGLPSQPRICD